MQMFTQKYAIIQPFEPLSVGDEFTSTSWPLHTTLVDTFAATWSGDLWSSLTALTTHTEPFDCAVGHVDYFGASGDTIVTLLLPTPALLNIHTSLVDTLLGAGATLNDPHFAHTGFKPHATVQQHLRLNEGDQVQFTELFVIDMFPDGDPNKRKVLRSLLLGSH